MAYKNRLKNFVKTVETSLDNKSRYYKLSHVTESILLEEKSWEELNSYIEDNYLSEDLVNIGEVINDLIMFKSCRDNIKADIENTNRILDSIRTFTIAFITTIVTIFVSLYKQPLILKQMEIIIWNAFVFYIIVRLLISEFKIKKNVKFNNLKAMNSIIYILENMKEDIFANPIEEYERRDFEVEVDNLNGQVSKSRKYFIKVTESLENKK